MSFLPKEAQDRIKEKEQYIHQLEEENRILKENQGSGTRSRLKVILPWGLFLIATLVAVWSLWGRNTSPEREIPHFLNEAGEWTSVSHLPDSGVVFTVQIGAFEGFSLSSANGKVEEIYQQKNDGMEKVMLGSFDNLSHAQGFQSQLVELGLGNAYIVAYDNGRPIGLVEAAQKKANEEISTNSK